MATDFKVGAGGLNPAFLFHLGDVIYGNDKGNHYGERFYIPYKHYPGKILTSGSASMSVRDKTSGCAMFSTSTGMTRHAGADNDLLAMALVVVKVKVAIQRRKQIEAALEVARVDEAPLKSYN